MPAPGQPLHLRGALFPSASVIGVDLQGPLTLQREGLALTFFSLTREALALAGPLSLPLRGRKPRLPEFGDAGARPSVQILELGLLWKTLLTPGSQRGSPRGKVRWLDPPSASLASGYPLSGLRTSGTFKHLLCALCLAQPLWNSQSVEQTDDTA